MTTRNTVAKVSQSESHFRFPDPPEREPDDMTSFDQLALTGNVHYLIQHLGNPDTTLVAGEHYLALDLTRNLAGVRYPDLLIAFNVDPAAYRRSNAYVISEQGKPPDFVLEIASRRTGRVDVGAKRDDYATLGILEYWRFDETETGRWHGARLAGDRLVDGRYVPIAIEPLANNILQGYSTVLDLRLRWERGQLGWYDPATGRHIVTFEDLRARSDAAEARADVERAARIKECQARIQAEAQARELAEELQRLRGSQGVSPN